MTTPPIAPATPALLQRKLPIGIQKLREIIEEGYYYVDKSAMAVRLANQGKYYFLSRPRRFGKSLFLDTLRELFEGNRALFIGLAAENRWDWSKTYPVIQFNFADCSADGRQALDKYIGEQLDANQNRLGLMNTRVTISGRFEELLRLARAKYGRRVVVLIDDCDGPVFSHIAESSKSQELQAGLLNLYSVIKEAGADIQFAMFAGEYNFRRSGMFSGLNNLTDITLDERYSDICGYTDADIDTVFAPELPGLDRELIRQWYNGYNWLGTSVYNPFGLLMLFRTRHIRPHWFETGTPTFLIKLLQQRQQFTPDLSRIVASESLLSTFDVDNIPAEALMFQAGYLTIASHRNIMGRLELTLKYPNLEVQAALNDSLLQSLTGAQAVPGAQISKLYDLLMLPDFAGLKALFHAFYASIAHDWYRKNELSNYEGYYVSIFYSYFAALGLDIRLEDPSNFGSIDMTVLFNAQVFLFEFKVVELNPAGKALQQIKDMRYADKYQALGQPIHQIGVEFSKTSRNIVGFEVETIQKAS